MAAARWVVLPAGFLFWAVGGRRKVCVVFVFGVMHYMVAPWLTDWVWLLALRQRKMAFAFGGGDGGVFPVVGGLSCYDGALVCRNTSSDAVVGRVRPSSYGCGSAVTALARRVSSFGRQVSPRSRLYSVCGELADAGRWWA